ncbi:MAG: hypothetical protein Q9214_002521, partial [Letrouitia sp. 1 TL-2023]
DRSRSRSRRRRSYSRSRSPPRRYSLSPRRERDRSPRRLSEERRDGRANGSDGRKKEGHRGDRSPPPPKPKEKKNKPAAMPQEMIVVNVNDRLGTKTAIPCLASDPIGLFKAQVAARIGRKPHEIMLKRQGERPFKDQLTLEDYGVSNGVQLDLEVDTGD